MLTGDAILDRRITELDMKLLGSSAVRVLTLAEVKDGLLERKEQALAEGHDEAMAARLAVESAGPLDGLAKAQAEELMARAVKMALQSGSTFGLFVAGFQLLVTHSWQTAILSALLQGVFFGVVLAWWMVFIQPSRRLPSKESGEIYTVAYSKAMRIIGKVQSLFFAGVSLYCMAIVAVPSLMPSLFQRYPRWAVLLLGGMGIFDLLVVSLTWRKYLVDAEGFWIDGPFTKQRVMWSGLRRVGTLGDTRRWLPAYWNKLKVVEYVSSTGARRCVFLYPEMFNADRLLVSIREHLA